MVSACCFHGPFFSSNVCEAPIPFTLRIFWHCYQPTSYFPNPISYSDIFMALYFSYPLFFFFFLYLKGSSMIHRVKKRWSLGELCEPGSRFRLLLWYQNSFTSSNSKWFPLFFSWVWTLLPDIFILNSRRFPSFRGVITCGHLTLRIHGCCNM